MRAFTRFGLFFMLAAIAPLGCGTEERTFESEGIPDSGGLDATVTPDSGTPDTSVPDTSVIPESGQLPETDPVDSGAPPDSAPVDTCVPNACGGCGFLVGKPGDACGKCGAMECSSDKLSLTCNDPGTNACGGCGALTGKAGDPCGTCGTLECAPDGSKTVCNDPGKNACGGCTKLAGAPGDSCGTCGGKQACMGTDALTCTGATPTNKCGGCTVLTNDVGKACGACGSGKYECSGPEATTCNDPVKTPAPGTVCGTCKTSSYACSADKLSTSCTKPTDTNSCGACGVLPAEPGSACGTCGINNCSGGGTTVTCTEATPAVGTKCGICGTSTYACTPPAKTACTLADDRKSGTDFIQGNASSQLDYRMSFATDFAIAYTTAHTGSIRNLALVFSASGGTGGVVGNVYVSVYQGTPAAPGSLLQTVTHAGNTFGTGARVSKNFSFNTASVPAGTPVFFHIRTDSTSYVYSLWGTTKSANAFYYGKPGGWSLTSWSPFMLVDMLGCGF